MNSQLDQALTDAHATLDGTTAPGNLGTPGTLPTDRAQELYDRLQRLTAAVERDAALHAADVERAYEEGAFTPPF